MKKSGGLFWLFVGCFLCMAGNVFAFTFVNSFTTDFEIYRISPNWGYTYHTADYVYSNGYVAWYETKEAGSNYFYGGGEPQVYLYDGNSKIQISNITEPNPEEPENQTTSIQLLGINKGVVSWRECLSGTFNYCSTGEVKTHQINNYTPQVIPKSEFVSFDFEDDLYIFDGEVTKLTDDDRIIGELGFSEQDSYLLHENRVDEYYQSGNSLLFFSKDYNPRSRSDTFLSFYDYQNDKLYKEDFANYGGMPLNLRQASFSGNTGVFLMERYEDDLYYFKYNPEQNTAAVPEPATMMLFGTGLLGAVVRRKRKA